MTTRKKLLVSVFDPSAFVATKGMLLKVRSRNQNQVHKVHEADIFQAGKNVVTDGTKNVLSNGQVVSVPPATNDWVAQAIHLSDALSKKQPVVMTDVLVRDFMHRVLMEGSGMAMEGWAAFAALQPFEADRSIKGVCDTYSEGSAYGFHNIVRALSVIPFYGQDGQDATLRALRAMCEKNPAFHKDALIRIKRVRAVEGPKKLTDDALRTLVILLEKGDPSTARNSWHIVDRMFRLPGIYAVSGACYCESISNLLSVKKEVLGQVDINVLTRNLFTVDSETQKLDASQDNLLTLGVISKALRVKPGLISPKVVTTLVRDGLGSDVPAIAKACRGIMIDVIYQFPKKIKSEARELLKQSCCADHLREAEAARRANKTGWRKSVDIAP